VVLQQRRPVLADDRRAVARAARQREQRASADEAAAHLLVELAEHGVVLDLRDARPVRAAQRERQQERVAEHAGVAGIVPVASAAALGIVSVGYTECELVKVTPCLASDASAGAVSIDTMPARSPSGTNRMTFGGGSAARVPARAPAHGDGKDQSERHVSGLRRAGARVHSLDRRIA
jgi:hypothetical protein